MELDQTFQFLKYSFLGIFIVLFVLEMKTKKSYKVYYHIAITLAVVFAVILWEWPNWFKVLFVALFVWLTIKAIVEERKKAISTRDTKDEF